MSHVSNIIWWFSRSVLSMSLRPMDCSLPGSSSHGIFPGKNTGVGCHFLLQGIFPTQGLNPGLLHCGQILHRLSYQGNPIRPVKTLTAGSTFSRLGWVPRRCIWAHITLTLKQTREPHLGITASSYQQCHCSLPAQKKLRVCCIYRLY